MSCELDHIWAQVQTRLALSIDEPTYRIWLEPLRPVELTETRLVVHAPAHSRRWIAERFGRILQAAAELVLGEDIVLELDDHRSPHSSPAGARPPRTPAQSQPASQRPAAQPPTANPKLTFDHFVIGDCNRLAHAAALSVAEMPGHAYNPLFICGPPGVGKTHLLNAIATLIAQHDPGLAVRSTSGEAFTNEFLGALDGRRTDTFKAHFRDVDVLLLDDVQFLERKARTEEEFFHTFNALYDAGRQIVLTSDRPPRDLQALEDRLRERFAAGLVADLRPPELATRVAILRKRAQHDRLAADDDALREIAERVRSNVRALEGALIRVVAFSSLTRRPLTAELAREVLDGLYPQLPSRSSGPRTIAEIQAAACTHFGISASELLSTSRVARVAWPRQVAMYLARELTHESLPAIGRHFGGRDHSTVLHAHRRTSARLSTDADARASIEHLRRQLDDPQP